MMADNELAKLKARYRTVLVDRLSRDDLEELKFYVKNQIGPGQTIDPYYRLKLESKLREFLHEDVLRREIAGIEALIESLGPGDLGPGTEK